jgi:hypothetical protein
MAPSARLSYSHRNDLLGSMREARRAGLAGEKSDTSQKCGNSDKRHDIGDSDTEEQRAHQVAHYHRTRNADTDSPKGQSHPAANALAIGIGANTAIFSIFDGLLRPLRIKDAERLVILWNRSPGLNITEDWFSTAQYFDIKHGHHGFEQVAIAIGGNYNLTGSAEPKREFDRLNSRPPNLRAAANQNQFLLKMPEDWRI